MSAFPYVIAVAHPDWKRPRVDHTFEVAASRDDLLARLRASLEHCMRYYGIDTNDPLLTYSDFGTYCAAMEGECYMENAPWDYNVCVNGRWDRSVVKFEPEVLQPVLAKLRAERAAASASNAGDRDSADDSDGAGDANGAGSAAPVG